MKKLFTLALLLLPKISLACGGDGIPSLYFNPATLIISICLIVLVLKKLNKNWKIKLFLIILILIIAFIAWTINSAMQTTLCGSNIF